MNKAKFEAYLREQLSIINEAEIDEIIAEYLQHIDMRKAEGLSEEEAIKDFGDLEELVDDLLDAYKINRENREFKKVEVKIKNILNNSMDFINDIANSLLKLSASEVISLIIQFFLVIILMYVVTGVVDMIANIFIKIFYFRPYFITNIIRLIINFVRVVINVSLNLAILYWFAKERIITFSATKGKDINFRQPLTSYEEKQERKSNVSDVINEDVVTDESELDASTISFKEENISAKKVVRPTIKNERSFMDKLVKLNITILRVVVLIILIPAIVASIFIGMAFIWLFFATISGYGSVGLTLILTGSLIIWYSLVIWGIGFVGGNKHEKSSNNI